MVKPSESSKTLSLFSADLFDLVKQFKDRYRWRAGAEGTMSEYDRKVSVKHLRVRGLKSLRFCATLKATGVNIFRATAIRKALSGYKKALERCLSDPMHAISVIKEPFLRAVNRRRNIFIPLPPIIEYSDHSCVRES